MAFPSTKMFKKLISTRRDKVKELQKTGQERLGTDKEVLMGR
jgi:hypothetical protein